MLHTRWSAAVWAVVRVEFRKALALRREVGVITLLADLEEFVRDHRPNLSA